jgi:hypothetical protein
MVEGRIDQTELVIDEQRCSIEENEVCFNKGERLVSPNAGVARVGDSSEARAR